MALFWFVATMIGLWVPASQAAEPLSVLFLGDKGHHRPADLAGRLIPALRKKGIELTYTEEVGALHPDKLKDFDGLLIYANIDSIEPDQEKALLDFVASGKGFIPIHCATYCFRNSPDYIALCGAQFQSHGGEEFETIIVAPEHPVMQGFGGFRSWDETYVHHMHNTKDRTVLEVRRLDLGPHSWRGPRLLHRLGARHPHLAAGRFCQFGGTWDPMGLREGSCRRWSLRRCIPIPNPSHPTS